MTKVKLKDATRDLLKGAADTLSSVSSMRKSADELTQAARKLEAKFLREEEQRRADEKQAEQQRLISQHTKAFTMPDTDEPAQAPRVDTKEEIPAVPKAEATSKGAAQTAPVEGDFYQTENIYDVFVYARRPGERYDRLVGWRQTSYSIRNK